LFDSQGNPLAGNLTLDSEGEEHKTRTQTNDWGVALQLQYRGKIMGRDNRFTVGTAYDGHSTRFTQSEAPSVFAPRGNSVGTVRSGALETDVDVATGQQNVGVYLADTFEIVPQLGVTVAGRFQHVSIKIRDRSEVNPALSGNHSFDHVSPA